MPPARALLRLLTFRLTPEQFASLDRRHLITGLICTWVVGMGRWWDDPDAHLLQHLGLGSVIYAFVLAAIVWIVVLPLRPARWSYPLVLTFVAMTAPPAALYAIPVERFFDPSTAGRLNLGFLAAVALWRVALLLRFLVLVPKIGPFKGIVAALLPLTAIVSALAALNLHRVVFSIMGSIAEHETTAHDAAYFVLVMLTYLSIMSLPVLALAYLGAVVHSRKRGHHRPT